MTITEFDNLTGWFKEHPIQVLHDAREAFIKLEAQLATYTDATYNALNDLQVDGHTKRGVCNAIAELEKVKELKQ
jgi:hypothetical protein